MQRKIIRKVQGYPTQDGAGVSLVRVLNNSTVEDFDPILMLDSFDSTDPAQYKAGFPLHPHRGIETVSLISQGNMVHKDSLGHQDAISDGEVQWMTAGSGIMHEEMLPASPRMLGVQLWLNLPASQKMAPPAYHSLKRDQIPEIAIPGGILRLVSGSYGQEKGFQGRHLPLDYYHILLEAGSSLELTMEQDKSVMVFTLSGAASVSGELLAEKTAAKLSAGTNLKLAALDDPIEILYMASDRLDEPVAWGGPIVMNTREELNQAFRELRNNTFLKEETSY